MLCVHCVCRKYTLITASHDTVSMFNYTDTGRLINSTFTFLFPFQEIPYSLGNPTLCSCYPWCSASWSNAFRHLNRVMAVFSQFEIKSPSSVRYCHLFRSADRNHNTYFPLVMSVFPRSSDDITNEIFMAFRYTLCFFHY